jgi:hypothetical protein
MAKQLAKRTMKKNMKKKRQGGRNLYGIKQGVGAVTKNAFPKPKRGAKKRVMSAKNALNALHPCHLPLPRAVGGYSVIRTTDIINTPDEAVMFGCFKGPGAEFTETCWLDAIAVRNAGGA